MKTIINPNAASFQLRVFVSIQNLETEGWDFDQYHENTANALGLSIEQAQQKNYQEYTAYIDISGTPENPLTSYGWYSHDRNEYTEREDTGDNKQTIKDIINLIDQGLVTIEELKDFTVDSEDRYCPTFIQVETKVTTTVYSVKVNENTTVQLITDYPDEKLSSDNFSLRTSDYGELSDQGFQELKEKIISGKFNRKDIEVDLQEFGYKSDDTVFLMENYGVEA